MWLIVVVPTFAAVTFRSALSVSSLSLCNMPYVLPRSKINVYRLLII